MAHNKISISETISRISLWVGKRPMDSDWKCLSHLALARGTIYPGFPKFGNTYRFYVTWKQEDAGWANNGMWQQWGRRVMETKGVHWQSPHPAFSGSRKYMLTHDLSTLRQGGKAIVLSNTSSGNQYCPINAPIPTHFSQALNAITFTLEEESTDKINNAT